jgi:hypothetical protein
MVRLYLEWSQISSHSLEIVCVSTCEHLWVHMCTGMTVEEKMERCGHLDSWGVFQAIWEIFFLFLTVLFQPLCQGTKSLLVALFAFFLLGIICCAFVGTLPNALQSHRVWADTFQIHICFCITPASLFC